MKSSLRSIIQAVNTVALATAALLPFNTASAAAVPSKKTQASSPVALASNPVAKDASRFSPGFNMNYSVSTDLAQNRSPRLFRHALGLGGLLEVKTADKKETLFVTGIDLTGEYISLGSEIEDRGRFIELADTTLWAEKPFALGQWLDSRHGLTINGSASLPTSEDSRFEGVKGIYTLAGRVDSTFREGRLGVSNGLTGFAYAQEFKQSPVSGQINPDAAMSYSVSGRIRLPWGFRFGAGVSAKMTHYLDSTQTLSFSNFQSLTFAWKSLKASLKHTNGNHLNDPSFSLWYVDEYRRVVSLSIGYEY